MHNIPTLYGMTHRGHGFKLIIHVRSIVIDLIIDTKLCRGGVRAMRKFVSSEGLDRSDRSVACSNPSFYFSSVTERGVLIEIII